MMVTSQIQCVKKSLPIYPDICASHFVWAVKKAVGALGSDPLFCTRILREKLGVPGGPGKGTQLVATDCRRTKSAQTCAVLSRGLQVWIAELGHGGNARQSVANSPRESTR